MTEIEELANSLLQKLQETGQLVETLCVCEQLLHFLTIVDCITRFHSDKILGKLSTLWRWPAESECVFK